jgi:REP element-mobilizing transposase RayT
VTYTVVNWVDVFTREQTRQIVVDSLSYCSLVKGLNVHAWCIMTNHVHLIVSSRDKPLDTIIGQHKRHVSMEVRKWLSEDPTESRAVWMLAQFNAAGTANSNNNDFQFWQQHNHPILLYSRDVILQKLNYIHNNPVRAGFIAAPEHWLWSSAVDYAGGTGLLKELRFLEL